MPYSGQIRVVARSDDSRGTWSETSRTYLNRSVHAAEACALLLTAGRDRPREVRVEHAQSRLIARAWFSGVRWRGVRRTRRSAWMTVFMALRACGVYPGTSPRRDRLPQSCVGAGGLGAPLPRVRRIGKRDLTGGDSTYARRPQ